MSWGTYIYPSNQDNLWESGFEPRRYFLNRRIGDTSINPRDESENIAIPPDVLHGDLFSDEVRVS
jgi:hypothetical protein